jgi:hypothetical protein
MLAKSDAMVSRTNSARVGVQLAIAGGTRI